MNEEFLKDFKERHPEWKEGDNEALVELLATDYATASAANAAFTEREKAMADMLSADPRTAIFLRNWSQGHDPVVELIRQFGNELRDALDNPELQQQIAEANREYLERVAREKRLGEEIGENIAKSLEMVERKCRDEQLDDSTVERAWEWLRDITEQGLRGIVSDDAFDMALKAINHDANVARAQLEGEIAGRNTAIDAHLRERRAADGTMAGCGAGATQRKRARRDLGVLDHFNDYHSVWD